LPNLFLARGSAYIGNLLESADRSNLRALVSLNFRGDTRNCRPRSHDNGDNHHRRDRFPQTFNYGDGSNAQKLTDSTRSDFARPKTPNCRQSTLRPPHRLITRHHPHPAALAPAPVATNKTMNTTTKIALNLRTTPTIFLAIIKH